MQIILKWELWIIENKQFSKNQILKVDLVLIWMFELRTFKCKSKICIFEANMKTNSSFVLSRPGFG